jgi:hypothetical protein
MNDFSGISTLRFIRTGPMMNAATSRRFTTCLAAEKDRNYYTTAFRAMTSR